MPDITLTRRAFTLAAGATIIAPSVVAPTTAAAAASTPQSPWGRVADMPIKLQEIYPAALKGRLHVAGGFISTLGIISGGTARHISYDPIADKWTELSPLPAARHHPNLVNHKNRLYALGGFEAKGPQSVWVMQDQTWGYDDAGDTWLTGSAAPQPHGETVTASLGNSIHVVGGRTPKGAANAAYQDHADTDQHFRYTPDDDKWETMAPALTKRNSAAGSVINGNLFICGGRTVRGGNVADLEIYDPKEDKWRNGRPMPQAQAGLAAAALGGKLYAFGGEYFTNGGGVYRECWAYDPATDQWEAINSNWTPRHGLGAVTIGEAIYVIGGATKPSGNGTSALVERFTPGNASR